VLPEPRNPDDSSPSKSRYTASAIQGGTEVFLEVRSPYDAVCTRRIGEVVLWDGPDGTLTIRAYDMTDDDGR
jgi:hypothetical protein